MDKYLSELISQAPSLVGLILIVAYFLRHMAKRDEILERISSSCHEVQEKAHECIRNNSEVLGEVKGVLLKLNGTRR